MYVVKSRYSYNFWVILLAFVLLFTSSGYSFYTHLCTFSNQVNLLYSPSDPCTDIKAKKDCCAHPFSELKVSDCCKINFIIIKIKENIQPQKLAYHLKLKCLNVFIDKIKCSSDSAIVQISTLISNFYHPPNLVLKDRTEWFQTFLC